MRITRHWRVGLLAAAAATALACSGVPEDTKPLGTASSGAAAPAAAQSQAPAVKYDTPTAKDFQLPVKILEKQCFGSAGCNIKYRVSLTLVGNKKFDPSKTYEISYTMKGLDDPEIGTIEVTGDQYTQIEERGQTPSSSSKVTAVITEVSEA